MRTQLDVDTGRETRTRQAFGFYLSETPLVTGRWLHVGPALMFTRERHGP